LLISRLWPKERNGVLEMPHVNVTVIGNAPSQEQKSARLIAGGWPHR
jgi:hypothetical protein